MNRKNTMIEHMIASSEGKRALTEGELYSIKHTAGRLANTMMKTGMDRDEAIAIWNHVIEIADDKGIQIEMPAIPEPDLLYAGALHDGSMVYAGEGSWADHAKTSRKTDPTRWR